MSDPIREEIETIARSVCREEMASSSPTPAAVTSPVDQETQSKVGQYLLIAHKPYLTRREAALYLDVSERSISEWAARPPDQNPFPLSNAGGEPRVKRERIDEWADRERARQRLKLAG